MVNRKRLGGETTQLFFKKNHSKISVANPGARFGSRHPCRHHLGELPHSHRPSLVHSIIEKYDLRWTPSVMKRFI